MNIRDFSEFTIELFVSLILSDLEEVIQKGKSSIRKQEKGTKSIVNFPTHYPSINFVQMYEKLTSPKFKFLYC